MGRRRAPGAANCGDGLFDASKIDVVSISPDGTAVLIHLVADLPWTDADDQINSLQLKVHHYVSFAIDGQLERTYPETAGLRWELVIDCQTGSPPVRTAQVLSQITEGVRRHGGDLRVEAT